MHTSIRKCNLLIWGTVYRSRSTKSARYGCVRDASDLRDSTKVGHFLHTAPHTKTHSRKTPSKRKRRRGEALDHLQLPFFYAVPHANYILPPPWVGASSSTMPEQSMPTQQMPAQQMPAQQMPVQEAPLQYPTGPQSPPRQPWAQQPTQQSTLGMNPGLARAMMQDS